MAVSTSTLHGNGKVIGAPQLTQAFDKFSADATPLRIVGYKVSDAEGNVYVYSHFGADTTRGLVVAQDISESSLVDSDGIVIASASSVNTNDSLVGGKFTQITLATTSASQYAGGKLVITDDAGEGYTYDIINNTATDDPASGDIRIELKQPLQVALTTASDIAIYGGRYTNLEGADSTVNIGAVGVSCASIDFSEAPYGWIQTQGVVGIEQSGAITVGSGAMLATAVDANDVGTVIVAGAAATDVLVGTCLVAGDDTGFGVFKIDL